MSKRGRVLAAVGAIVVVQLCALAAYRAIEDDKAVAAAGGRFDAHSVSPPAPIPAVSFETRNGERRVLAALTRPTLVHFWATWCVPCREELPALLAASDADALGATLVAVSVDESWRVIDAFTDAAHPAIARVDHEAAKEAFGLGPLPVTLVVDNGGLVRGRFQGAQPWSNAKEAKRVIASLLSDGPK